MPKLIPQTLFFGAPSVIYAQINSPKQFFPACIGFLDDGSEFSALKVFRGPWPRSRPQILKYYKNTAFALTFLKSSRQLFAFFPVTRVSNPMELFRKTCSDELFYFGWSKEVPEKPRVSPKILGKERTPSKKKQGKSQKGKSEEIQKAKKGGSGLRRVE